MANRFHTNKQASPRERGYDHKHNQEARRRRASATPHDRCGYCRLALGPERLPGDPRSLWELAHLPDRSGYYPGLWHRACNRREAAIRGGQISRRPRQQQRAQTRAW